MKIGLRTIKTAISAALAISLAGQLGLIYPTAAGIIALLSVTNTKRSSFQVGFYRLCSLALATCIAFFCFNLIGYTAIAFGFFLLFFIPLAVAGKMTEGIPVSSVLVTHYLIKQTMDPWLIRNAFLLMIIGVGMAIIMNLYMPNIEGKLKADQLKIEEEMRLFLYEMARTFEQKSKKTTCAALLVKVEAALVEGETWAKKHAENQLLSKDHYYLHYFDMRKVQIRLLKDMDQLLQEIALDTVSGEAIKELFAFTAQTFSKENDGKLIRTKIAQVYAQYKIQELPRTRAEFESRAKLYQLLTQFQTFIEIKVEFLEQKAYSE